MSTFSHSKQNNPLGFHFSIPPIMNRSHKPLCTSCLDSFKHKKSVLCLGLLPEDSWDSCCQLHWKPFLVPKDGMRRQGAAGWDQRLPAIGLCQQPSQHWLSSSSRGWDQNWLPWVTTGGCWWGPQLQAAETAGNTCNSGILQ